MKENSLKFNKKEARILSSLLWATQTLVQLHYDEENNVKKRAEKGKYLKSILDMKAKTDLFLSKPKRENK